MTIILWTNYFFHAKGYINSNTVLYQDNKSVILLKKNENISINKITKCINNHFYFIADRINNEELSVKYFPNEEMLRDLLTKPLKGKLFLKFHLLNHEYKIMSIC